jgi:hypothetical protein
MEQLQSRYGKSKEIVFHLPPKEFGDFNKMNLETSRHEIMEYFHEILLGEKI